jgi:hypothetical protein
MPAGGIQPVPFQLDGNRLFLDEDPPPDSGQYVRGILPGDFLY